MYRYGSKAWTSHKCDKQHIIANEMKFLRRTAGCTKFDRKKNVEILQELQIDSVLETNQHSRTRWRNHMLRMSSRLILHQILNVQPKENF